MTAGDAETQRRIRNRLVRARGQLNALIAAMEDGAPCRDVVTQLAAVSSALDRAGFAIIATAMKDCVVDDTQGEAAEAGSAPDDQLTVEELEKLFLTLA